MSVGFTIRKKRKKSRFIGVDTSRSRNRVGFQAKKIINLENESFTIFSKIYDNEEDAARSYDKLTMKLNPNRNNRLNFPKCRQNQEDKQSKKPKNRKRKRRSYPIYQNTLTNTDKWRIQARQNFCCNLCGRSFTSMVIQPDADHVRPLQFGGTNNYDNLQSLCKACHAWKTQHFDKVIGEMVAYKDYDRETFLKLQKEHYLKKHGVMNIPHNIMLNNTHGSQVNIGCNINQ